MLESFHKVLWTTVWTQFRLVVGKSLEQISLPKRTARLLITLTAARLRKLKTAMTLGEDERNGWEGSSSRVARRRVLGRMARSPQLCMLQMVQAALSTAILRMESQGIMEQDCQEVLGTYASVANRQRNEAWCPCLCRSSKSHIT